MVRFLLDRLLRLISTLLLSSALVFLAARIIPGDPAEVIAGIGASQQEVETLRRHLGLHRPAVVQYLVWVAAAARLDFGRSALLDASVGSLIAQRLPITLTIAGGAFALMLIIALPLGLYQALHAGGLADRIGAFATDIVMGIPEFWLAIILLLLFAVNLPLFPLFGVGGLRHLALPIATLGISRAAQLARITRAAARAAIERPFVTVAHARGLSLRRIRYRYILLASLIPVISIAAIQFGYLIGGAIIVEQIFALPGLGRLLVTAISNRDLPLIQGATLCITALFACFNLAADLLSVAIDPRLRT